MAVKGNKEKGAERRARRTLNLVEPEVGYLQAAVLAKLDELGDDAFGFKVLEELTVERADWVDPSQVYGSIRKLLLSDLIKQVDTRASPVGGPPMKIYRLTEAGVKALETTMAHHQGIFEYLQEWARRRKK